MTDREKLINLMEGHCDYAGHIDCKADCTACLADHLIANGVTFAKDIDVPSKWISVEKEKPDEFVSVLGHITDAGDFPAVRECYRVGNVFFFPALLDVYRIDKWTYIPEPAKEDV